MYEVIFADLLIIGVGDPDEINHVNPDFVRHIRMNKLDVEILPTVRKFIYVFMSKVTGSYKWLSKIWGGYRLLLYFFSTIHRKAL